MIFRDFLSTHSSPITGADDDGFRFLVGVFAIVDSPWKGRCGDWSINKQGLIWEGKQ